MINCSSFAVTLIYLFIYLLSNFDVNAKIKQRTTVTCMHVKDAQDEDVIDGKYRSCRFLIFVWSDIHPCFVFFLSSEIWPLVLAFRISQKAWR